MIQLNVTDLTIDAQALDGTSPRTITGLAVPWDVATVDSMGQKVLFEKNSLPENGRAPKLVESHDLAQVRGLVTERVSTDQGMMFSAKIAATQAGNDALELLKMGALDAVSVGVQPVKYKFDADGTMRVKSAIWHELSLVAVPAFDQARITSVSAAAPEEDEELSEEPEQEPTIEPEEDSMNEETPIEVAASAPIPTQPIAALPRREFKLPSAAEYISKFVAGGSEFAEFNARIKAAAPDVTTGDLDGSLPLPLVQPIYDSLNPIRPVAAAIGSRAMPSMGATFRRPVLTVRPTATAQDNQLDPLSPSTVTVTNNNVDKVTVGTYVLLSEQSIDWTDPSSVDIVIRQLAIAYGEATDQFVCDALTDQTAQTGNWNSGDAAATIAGIYTAAATISSVGNYLPTHAFVTPAVWASLGSLTDDTGRPLFPSLAPMNAAGVSSATTWNGNPLGLDLVVDKNLAEGTFIVGHAAGPMAGLEFYEQPKGAISIDVPSQLGRQIAFRGYVAQFMANADLFVQLNDQA